MDPSKRSESDWQGLVNEVRAMKCASGVQGDDIASRVRRAVRSDHDIRSLGRAPSLIL